jgi:hypothetical protein
VLSSEHLLEPRSDLETATDELTRARTLPAITRSIVGISHVAKRHQTQLAPPRPEPTASRRATDDVYAEAEASSGNVSTQVVPFPGSLSIAIAPDSARTAAATAARPTPRPDVSVTSAS